MLRPGFVAVLLFASFTWAIIGPPSADPSFPLPPVQKTSHAPVTGTLELLVVLVQFSDQANNRDVNFVRGLLDDMNDYYRTISYGKASFRYDASPASGSWHLMPNTMPYYGADTTDVSAQLVTDSLNAAKNSGIDISSYSYAMVIHAGNDEARSKNGPDIISYTLPDYTFISPPLTKRLPTSVVAEEDPMGVFGHEAGHLLGLPDLYDYPGGESDANNWMDRWELMAVGEWNPRGDVSTQGTVPSELGAWSRVRLGWVTSNQVLTVNATQRMNVTLDRIELASPGFQVLKLPITITTYYLVEVRDDIGYDAGLPGGSFLPGMLVTLVDDSKGNGEGPVRVIDANPGAPLFGSDFDDAAFTYSDERVYWDPSNYVQLTILEPSTTSVRLVVDRSDAPSFPLRVKGPREGVWVSVDSQNATTNSAGDANFLVPFGPHEVRIQPQVPVTVTIGANLDIGLVDLFTAWDTGSTNNPILVTVNQPVVLTAIYRRAIQSSLVMALIAGAVLVGLATTLTVVRRRKAKAAAQPPPPARSESPATTVPSEPAPENESIDPNLNAASSVSSEPAQDPEG